jgi:hypothetical protein
VLARWLIAALEESFHTVQHLLLSVRRMHGTTKLATISHTVRKPASELFHFAYTIGQVGSSNFPVVARE